jgi:hypothetical protein
VNAEEDSNNEGFQYLFLPVGKIFFINVFKSKIIIITITINTKYATILTIIIQ